MATITETNGDASDDFDTQYALSLGDIFQGAHDTYSDADWVRVELSSETIYNFTLRAETESIRFKLVDSEGGLHLHSNFSSTGSTLIFQPIVSGTYYIDIFSFGNDYPIDYEVELAENTIPIGTYDDLADYLTDGYAEWSYGSRATFDIEPGGTLTANITALSEAGQQLARWALEAWTNVSGIKFEFVDDDDAHITFYEDGDEGYAGNSFSDGIINSSWVNIPPDWLTELGDTIYSFTFFAYMHEIGHALGLGHPGPYPKTLENRTEDTTFGIDNAFLIDSTQATLMSYIDEGANTYIEADTSIEITPMIVDIIAIQNLYGTPTDINADDTVYGYHSNVDGYLGEFFKLWTGQDNPFVSIGTEQLSKLDFADLDSDGDQDLVFVGFYSIYYFENTGTADSPDFTQLTGTANLLDGINNQFQYFVIDHALADLDNDGDVDLIVADLWGTIAYYENTGTATSPDFTRRTGAANPLDFIDKGRHSSLAPELADLDDDGDIDLVLGDFHGNISYFENTGTAATPVFTQLIGEASPLDGIFDESTRRHEPNPVLADLDGDGDMDLIIGEVYDRQLIFNYYENTGTASNPEFTRRTDTANPVKYIPGRLHLADLAPELVDIDDDGDLDLAFGSFDGGIHYAENAGTTTNPEFIATGLNYRASWTLYDNGGIDTLDLRTDTKDQQVDLRPEGISDVYGSIGNLIVARDTLIENFIAGSGSDEVIGNSAANNLEGRLGNDTLDGLAGDDTLYGNSGSDTLNGGADDDHLHGGAGADMLNGGPGADYAYYTDSSVGVLVRLHEARAVKYGEAEGDTLIDIEHLVGSEHNDILAGDGEDNILEGRNGDDVLYGGPAGGDDRMYGGNGDDRIFGGKGNDILTGGEGNDFLKGGPGEDTLIVDGDDMDVLYGGPDKDTFRFFPSNLGGGSIRDFSDGEDVIDLTEFAGVNSLDDLDIVSHGDNVRIRLSGTDYLTTIILSDFEVTNLDAADFLF